MKKGILWISVYILFLSPFQCSSVTAQSTSKSSFGFIIGSRKHSSLKHSNKQEQSIYYSGNTFDEFFFQNYPSKRVFTFDGCQFKDIESVLNQFRKLTFSKCNLNNYASFFSSEIGRLNLFHCYLYHPYFTGCTFDTLDLISTTLNCPSFYSCILRGIVDFEYCKITDSADFSDLKLDPSVKFIFQGAEFPHFLDLSQLVNIPTEIDLTVANFTENTQDKRILICLYNTDVSKIKMDYSHFTLWFPDSIRHKMGRSGERFSSEDKISIYESLLNNFKSRGQLESYERLDHEYRDYRSKRHWYLRPMALINRIWWNDGYTKGLVFFWAAIFIAIFTTINFFILSKLNENIYEMENLPGLSDMKIATKWWYSLVYTVGIFFRLTLKMEKLKYKNKALTTYIILIYTLGVICLAYMANFVLQK